MYWTAITTKYIFFGWKNKNAFSSVYFFFALQASALNGDSRFFSSEHVKIVFTSIEQEIKLTQRHIRPGSVFIMRGGKPLFEHKDFIINYETNAITLITSVFFPETLFVSFESFALDFKPYYEKRSYLKLRQSFKDSVADSAMSFPIQKWSMNETVVPEQDISVSGSKTISISMGSNSALGLNQSLDVNISGDIARDVTINAILTDQNVPIEPEGTTRSLQELDQVLIEIESRHFKIALGDCFLNFEDSKFLDYSRKIQGATIRYNDVKRNVLIAGAIERGEYNVFTFNGEEQKQGPYRLKSREGSENIVVIAGTEKVWVNGKPQRRGENNDYIIEYNEGQIFFTINRPIREEDYITVEYEYTVQAYERSIIGGEYQQMFFDDRLRLRVKAAQENDSRKHPIDRLYGDDEILALRNAGDKQSNAWTSGIVLISNVDELVSGEPFYTYDTLGSEIFFKYHAPDSFSYYNYTDRYRILFSNDSSGRYRMDSVNYYSYVFSDSDFTAGETRYRPGANLPLPRSLAMGGLELTYNGNIFNLKAEIAASDNDKNTYSEIDDHDNKGFAFAGEGLLKFGKYIGEKKALGILELKANYEKMDTLFKTLGNVRNVYNFQEKWNLRDINTEIVSELKEVSSSYAPINGLCVQGGGGTLKAPNVYSQRYFLGPKWEGFKNNSGFYTFQEINALKGGLKENVKKHDFSENSIFGRFGPFARLSQEGRKNTLTQDEKIIKASRFYEITAGFNIDQIRLIENTSEFAFRKDHSWRGHTYKDSAKATTFTNNFLIGPIGFFSTDIKMVNRRKTLYDPSSGATALRSDMVNLSTTLNPFENALFHKTNYLLSVEKSQILTQLYEEVPEGQGTHIMEIFTVPSGEQETIYVSVPEGQEYRANYILSRSGAYRVDSSHEAQNINNTEFGMHLEIIPRRYSRLKKLKGFFGDLSFFSCIRLEEEKISKNVSGLFRYFPNYHFNNIDSTDKGKKDPKAQNSLKTISSLMDFQQDITISPRDSKFKLKFKICPYKIRQFQGSRLMKDRNFYEVSHKTKLLPRLGILNQASSEENIQRYEFQYGHVFTRIFKTVPEYDISKKLKFILSVSGGKSRQALSDSSALFYKIMPKMIFSIASKGRFTAEYEFINVETDLNRTDYMMAEGNVPGKTHRWALSGDYQFSRNILFYIYYSGKLLRESPRNNTRIIHQGNVELKAFF